MKKKLLSALGIICLVIAIFGAIYLTRALEVYTISTRSNLPTLKNDSWVLASRFSKPDKGKFVVFEKDKYFWIFRCLAKGGDIVEIRNASVYVNGQLVNEPYTLKEYHIPTKDVLNMTDYIDKNNISTKEIYYGSSLITLSDDQYKNLKKDLKQFSKEKDARADEYLFPAFAKKGYNEDNMGPMKVPANSYFVLGDNRHDAFDSRYFGFVKASEIVSTVIF